MSTRFRSAPVLSWDQPGRIFVGGVAAAALLASASSPDWHTIVRSSAPRVTAVRTGLTFRVRVWWRLSINSQIWASPGFMDVAAWEYAAMKLRSWWRRKPLPVAYVVER